MDLYLWRKDRFLFIQKKKKEKTNFCISLTISQLLAPPSTPTEVFDMHHTWHNLFPPFSNTSMLCIVSISIYTIYKIVEPEDNRGESLHLNEKWDESHMGLEHFVAGDTSSLQSSLFWITLVHIGHQILIFISERKEKFLHFYNY